jgi:hypothetical protein
MRMLASDPIGATLTRDGRIAACEIITARCQKLPEQVAFQDGILGPGCHFEDYLIAFFDRYLIAHGVQIARQ